MKVSIIVPVYNVAPYIERCLNSVMSQTYTDIECILVDDCGTDNSMEIASQLINEYKGDVTFIVLRHQQNKGQSAARNYAMRVATGDYLFFLDSDDTITHDCIEILVKLAMEYPNVDMVQGNTTTYLRDCTEKGFDCEVPRYSCDKDLLHQLFLSKIVKNIGNRFVRRSFILEHDLFFPEGILHEDAYWLFFVTKYLASAAFTQASTYHYYMNENGVMNSVTAQMAARRINGYKISVKAFFNDIRQHGAASKYHRQYLADALINYALLLSATHASFSQWRDFWKIVIGMSIQSVNHFSMNRAILGLSLLPPLCFLIRMQGWQWRLRHYICKNV